MCRVVGQHRSTQRKPSQPRADEKRLTADIVRLASDYGRYGYRRITALLQREGWRVNAKRVERIWRREGLKVPQKQPRRGRLWLNDGHACGPGRCIAATSGVTTLLPIALMTAKRSGCSQ